MADIDSEFKPTGRPQSILAQDFALSLDSAFGLDEVSTTVQKKKEEVASAAAELEELEARLKAMEEQLQVNKRGAAPVAPRPPHLRAISVSQRPYLRGPIAMSVRPETPKTDGPAPQMKGETTTKSAENPQMDTKATQRMSIPIRKKHMPSDDDVEEESEESEEEDSDSSDREDTASSSSEELPQRR